MTKLLNVLSVMILTLAFGVSVLMAIQGPVSAGTVNMVLNNGQAIELDGADLCQMAKSGATAFKAAGMEVNLAITADGYLVVGKTVLAQKCKGKKTNKIAGGGVPASASTFVEDTSPTTTPEPVGDVEVSTPAGDGEPATDNGNEQPPQGGDVEGFEADNSPATDVPDPVGG